MIFLSHIIKPDIPSYGNQDKFIVEEISQISEGKSSNNSKWIFSNNHLGTHVDVPKHFFEQGKTITDYTPKEWIFTNVQVIDIPCRGSRLINADDMSNKINSKTDLLLIRTGYEQYRNVDKYWYDNPGLSADLGFWLREKFNSIRAIGFDFISLSSWKHREEGKKAHRAFLNPQGVGDPILIIEDMKLSNCNGKINKIIIAPLFIKNSNGAPVTVFAELELA